MVSTYELELFAKQAATEYLKDGKPLNDSIVKLASDHALNREQIARVVEAANTDVYINLFNKTAEKYVQFNTADPAQIELNLNTTKVAEVVDNASDYYDAPGYEAPEIVPIFEKVAEEVVDTKSNDEIMRDYWRFKGAEANLTSMILEGQQLYTKEADKLREMIKQSVLGGTPYNDIYNALSVNTDPIFTETLKTIEAELTPVMPLGSLTKTAAVLTTPVNHKHPLIQQSLQLVKIANEFKTVQEKLTELGNEWTLYKTSGKLSETVKTIATKAPVFATGALVGAGTAALSLPFFANESLKRQQNALNSVPVKYRG
jgi:hypothetical protein